MNRPPAANLWADGAVMLGKLNMDEFAMGSSNETPITARSKIRGALMAPTPILVPGGSSGGVRLLLPHSLRLAPPQPIQAARSVSPQPSPARLASSRLHGRVSRWARLPSLLSLDQVTGIACDVRDAAILLKSMVS